MKVVLTGALKGHPGCTGARQEKVKPFVENLRSSPVCKHVYV